jgi:hypothetical protein
MRASSMRRCQRETGVPGLNASSTMMKKASSATAAMAVIQTRARDQDGQLTRAIPYGGRYADRGWLRAVAAPIPDIPPSSFPVAWFLAAFYASTAPQHSIFGLLVAQARRITALAARLTPASGRLRG